VRCGSGTPLRVGGLGGIVAHPGDLGLHRVNGSSGRGLPTFAARLSDDEVAPIADRGGLKPGRQQSTQTGPSPSVRTSGLLGV
jgi:hypothetical protein